MASANDVLQNWPSWRKNLNFYALVYMSALVGVMKTIFISVNSVVSMTNGKSYTAVVALTAVPLMVSALTGMGSLVVGRIWGKRPVYLGSMVLIFIGVTWSMYVTDSYSQNMAARVFQGLGWGAFDTLVLGSLQDTFFVRGSQSSRFFEFVLTHGRNMSWIGEL
jgi:MFS family permease